MIQEQELSLQGKASGGTASGTTYRGARKAESCFNLRFIAPPNFKIDDHRIREICQDYILGKVYIKPMETKRRKSFVKVSVWNK